MVIAHRAYKRRSLRGTITDLKILDSGIVAVCGFADGSLTDEQGNQLDTNGGLDSFVALYSANGDILFNSLIGPTAHDDDCRAIAAIGSEDNLIVAVAGTTTGWSQSPLPDSSHAGFISLWKADTRSDIYLSNIGLKGAQNSTIADLVFADDRSIYTCGYTLLDTGLAQGFVCKIDISTISMPRLIWEQYFHSDSLVNPECFLESIKIDPNGDILSVGYIRGSDSKATITNELANNFNAYAIKLKPSGSFLDSSVFGTSADDYAYTVVTGEGSSAFVGGASSGSKQAFLARIQLANQNNDVALPSITLTVSPASVTEDGTTNLTYTFTRTGVTTGALTVNYTVGGTATLGADYELSGQIAFDPVNRTISFAAGSATAKVIVDPTVDSTVESGETVALTLAAGTSYTIGTANSVVGAITNDDFVSAATSTISVAQAALAFAGGRRIDWAGSEFDGIITGNANNNRLCGGVGKDLLTGGGTSDSDVFVYNSLDESLLGGYDVVTDYNSRDRIEAPAAVAKGANALTVSRGTASSLDPVSIENLLTIAIFSANNVAAFAVTGKPGTFIAMNDGRAGFQVDSDAIIYLQNYTINHQNFVGFL